jgi:hypothetical protein
VPGRRLPLSEEKEIFFWAALGSMCSVVPASGTSCCGVLS